MWQEHQKPSRRSGTEHEQPSFLDRLFLFSIELHSAFSFASQSPLGRPPLKTRFLPSLLRSILWCASFSLIILFLASFFGRENRSVRVRDYRLLLGLANRRTNQLARSLVVNLRNEACRKAAYQMNYNATN